MTEPYRSLLDMFKGLLWLLVGKRLQWGANAEAVRPVRGYCNSPGQHPSVELSTMVDMIYTCTIMMAPSHMWLQITRNMSCATEDLNFKFYFILITLTLNRHPGLAVTTRDSVGGNDLGSGGSSEEGKTWPELVYILKVGLPDFLMYW